MAPCSTTKTFSLHGFDEVIIRSAIGSNGVRPGCVDVHGHGVGRGGSILGAGDGSSGTAIADGIVPSAGQVDEFLEGFRLLGEFGNTQPFVYCVRQPVFESVLEVTV